MSEMNVNGIVLDDVVTGQLSELQDEYGRALSDSLGDVMDFILTDCTSKLHGREKELLSYVETLHDARKVLLKLVPKKRGGEQ